MAIISASARFTLNGLNFATLNNTEPTLFNNVFETFKGKTYEDVLTLRNPDDSGVNLAGKNFALNNNDSARSGVVQVIEGLDPGDKTVFDIRGLDLKLTVADKSISTSGFADDLKIWKAQFSGKDTMVLSNQGDTMRGFDGNDTMKGRGGADRLNGDDGNDKIYGGDGKDTLKGGLGADVLRGGAGVDKLNGGNGSDKLFGEAGNDNLTGAKGGDVFVFAKGGDRDKITDFGVGADMLQLSKNLWGGEDLTNAEVVDQFATKANGDITFDFGGGDVLVLDGYTKLGTLDDFIA